MASNIETFSIRIENSVISDFRNQARDEHITQGKLFEKVLNLYLGRSVAGEEQIPFSVHLFRFNNIKNEYLKKKIYDGYGVPLYFSQVFRFYGCLFPSDKKQLGDSFGLETNRASAISYRHNHSSELAFIPQMLLSFPWVSCASLESQAIEELNRDIGIDPQGYSFMSAFRVFKEWTDKENPFILVNEQMYLVEYYFCENIIKSRMVQEATGMDAKNMYNPYADSYDPNEPTRAEDLAFAVSTLYKIDDISKGEEILRLDRKYLRSDDVINLKNVLKPRISKNDNDLETILAEYSFKQG